MAASPLHQRGWRDSAGGRSQQQHRAGGRLSWGEGPAPRPSDHRHTGTHAQGCTRTHAGGSELSASAPLGARGRREKSGSPPPPTWCGPLARIAQTWGSVSTPTLRHPEKEGLAVGGHPAAPTSVPKNAGRLCPEARVKVPWVAWEKAPPPRGILVPPRVEKTLGQRWSRRIVTLRFFGGWHIN